MPYRSPARWLAPAALVAAALAVVIVLSSGGGSDSTTTSSDPARTTTATTTSTTSKAKRKTYTVKPGDVLSGIAASNGLTVEELQALNPDVDAQTIRPGQQLRLSR